MKKRFPFHPLLFALYPVLQLYSYNVGEARFLDALPAFVGTMLLAGLAVGVAWLLMKSLPKAAVMASAFMWLFLSWGNMHRMLDGMRIGHFHLAQPWVVLLVYLALLMCIALALRGGRDLFRLTSILNATGLFLVVACLVLLSIKASQLQSLPEAARQKVSAPRAAAGPGFHPDVYFILLDEHPRSDSLNLICGGDNRWFLDDLQSRGFYIANRSASNYPRTIMSMASMLNMSYLDKNLIGSVKEGCADYSPLIMAVAHNAVFNFAHEHGYQTVFLPPEYGLGMPGDVDLRLDSGVSVSDFNTSVLDMTPVNQILQQFAPSYTLDDLHRKHLLFTLEWLRNLPHMGLSPFFVYAHLLCPHWPIVWGANGEKVFLATRDPGGRVRDGNLHVRHMYADQVTYLDKLVLETVSTILTESKEPPVIILCSDHGTDFEVDWRSAEDSNMRERMANFAAFYFPHGGNKALYPTITNVNFFRLAFDRYFGATFEPLPDKSYFSTDINPYRFIPVPMEGPLTHKKDGRAHDAPLVVSSASAERSAAR